MEAGTEVLVVDDEESIRWIVADILKDDGCIVEVAEDGFVAFRYFVEFRPNLIVTDIGMPGLNGLELTRRIKREYPEVKTKIIVMSAGMKDPNLSAEEEAKKAGADAFISKPIDAAVLVETVERLLWE